MHRLTVPFVACSLVGFLGCGGSKPAANATDKADAGEKTDDVAQTSGESAATEGETPPAPKKDECTGFEFANLEDTLLKSSCEAPNLRPDGMTQVDLKGKLEVKVAASPTKVSPGGKAELVVTFTNKGKDPLTLHFRIDPVARFDVETLEAKKNKRVDLPAGKPPPPRRGESQPPASELKTARVTLVPNGSARTRVAWEAVRTRWAPEKVRGTPPERGYPRSPAGPLPKGKYNVKVVTPLVGVSEGPDREMTAPTVAIEIGG